MRIEEDKVERLTVAAMEAEDDGNNRKQGYYETLIKHHESQVAEYMEEIAELKKQAKLASIMDYCTPSQPKKRE